MYIERVTIYLFFACSTWFIMAIHVKWNGYFSIFATHSDVDAAVQSLDNLWCFFFFN